MVAGVQIQARRRAVVLPRFGSRPRRLCRVLPADGVNCSAYRRRRRFGSLSPPQRRFMTGTVRGLGDLTLM